MSGLPALLPLVIGLLVVVVAVVVGAVRFGTEGDRWKKAGLLGVLEKLGFSGKAEGESRLRRAVIDGIEVELEELSSWRGGRVRLSARPEGLPRDLRMLELGDWQKNRAVQRGLSGLASPENPDRRTGDTEFDEVVVVQGPEHEALAFLDKRRRGVLRRAAGIDGFRVEDGAISFFLTDLSGEWLQGDVAKLVAMAGKLAVSGSIPNRLAEHVRSEASPQVRVANARCLFDHYGDSEAARGLGPELLQEGDPELRLIGACLVAAADAGPLLTIFGSRPAWSQLSEDALARGIDALAEADDPRIEELLVHLLGVPRVEVRIAAASGLERLGGRESVVPLLEAGERDRRVSDAVERAVTAIQSRLGDVDAGRLMVVDAEHALEGGLSVSVAEGALSEVSEADRPAAAASVRPPQSGKNRA